MTSKKKPSSASDMLMIKRAKAANAGNIQKRIELPHIDTKPDTKHPSYINKQCRTEHGTGFVCGIDQPESRAWRLLVKVTDNSGVKIHEGMFPDSILAYTLNEVDFLKE